MTKILCQKQFGIEKTILSIEDICQLRNSCISVLFLYNTYITNVNVFVFSIKFMCMFCISMYIILYSGEVESLISFPHEFIFRIAQHMRNGIKLSTAVAQINFESICYGRTLICVTNPSSIRCLAHLHNVMKTS